MLLLHIGNPVSPQQACSSAPRTTADVVTSAQARPEGASYFVYLLGTPVPSSLYVPGLIGCQMGITYTQAQENPALVLESWHLCADLEFLGDEWPASGTGNTITWTSCQRFHLGVAGYFVATAYAPAVISIVGYPATGLVKVANCEGAEEEVVNVTRAGWVSMGGGAIGNDTDGCNPSLGPCADVTPAMPTTWGRLKQLYNH